MNKQQTKQCRHLVNSSELFLAKSFHADDVKKGHKFPGKNAQKFVYKLNEQQIE